MASVSAQATSRAGRLADLFFLHLGSFVAVFVYFTIAGRAEYAPEAVRRALTTALVVAVAYLALARRRGAQKHFDYGLVALFAVGTVGTWAGVAPVMHLFEHYSGAALFGTLCLVALVPLLLGREPFTVHFARRQTPAWQQKLPSFLEVNRVLTAWWAALFSGAAALAAWAPRDPRFTVLYPNLLVLAGGLPATFWLPPLYLRLRPPPTPDTVEALILGMPFRFDRRAAAGVRTAIHFRVTGEEAGDYHVAIADGRCRSAPGPAPEPDLVIETPDKVWRAIARGELDAGAALIEGRYRATGDSAVLVGLRTWFPGRSQA